MSPPAIDSRWMGVLVLVVLMIAGLGCLARRLRTTRRQHNFALEYAERLSSYVTSEGRDTGAYAWLTHRSTAMQRQMGSNGIYAAYRPPFANFQYRDYPIVVNMLPDLRNAYADPVLARSLAAQYSNTLIDAIVRHLGTLEDRSSVITASLRNPFSWLREGAGLLVGVPLSLLASLGLISVSAMARWRANWFVRLMGGLVALITLASAVIGIVVGWDPFVAWLRAVTGQ